MNHDHDLPDDVRPRPVEALRASLAAPQRTADGAAPDLDAMRIAHENAHTRFENALASAFPGASEWDWLRACDHAEGDGISVRNEDTSRDAAMAAHPGVKAAWDAYIAALHAFYAMRDGPNGFLGGRGL